MDTAAQCENVAVAYDAVPGILRGSPKQQISRARLKELFALAYETVEWLEAKGLQKGEQCEFREIAERLWWKD